MTSESRQKLSDYLSDGFYAHLSDEQLSEVESIVLEGQEEAGHDFTNSKVDEICYNTTFGYGRIISINDPAKCKDHKLPIRCVFDMHNAPFDINGVSLASLISGHNGPTLFHRKLRILEGV